VACISQPELSSINSAACYTSWVRRRRFANNRAAIVITLLAASACLASQPQTNRPSTTGWALKPVERPAAPFVARQEWVRTPIDRFILAELERKGLQPSLPADKAALLRRATFDLHGLPPTPAEIDLFLSNTSRDAFARVIDRLLASPHYGERWARHWLDVVRFAESHGFEFDRLRENAWRYRDYVIDAFNSDKPYDEFVREQLAGDALVPERSAGIVATGFLVAGPWDQAGYTSASALLKERIREDELEDIIAAVGQTFLAFTINCARCHDHKFDPIPQRDYYRIKAALQGVRHGDRSVLTSDETRSREQRVTELKQQIAKLEARIGETQDQARAALEAELRQARTALTNLPAIPKAYAANPANPGPTFVLARGDIEKQKESVTAGGLSAITNLHFDLPEDAPEALRRVKLAEWMTDPQNPLTARVMVNRIWHYHFGRGLSALPNDFGFNGEYPSHPELLDWLAAEFVSAGWSIKHLHRLILLSSVYQQSSVPEHSISSLAKNIDAENRLLWKFPLRRLEAEAARDALLSVSGHLNFKLGGGSYRPFKVTVSGSNFYEPIDENAPEFFRRTVYRMGVHSGKDALLDSLDCPDPSTKTPARAVTTTPIQSLGLMNNPFVLRQARQLAMRLQREAGDDLGRQIHLAYRLAFGRTPDVSEKERAAKLARQHGLESLAWALINASEFVYVR
jgi:hypothetical protein